ncbi:MAG TPA: hypothetical protein VJB98_04060 [Candidatus Paceibacterota bacterium]
MDFLEKLRSKPEPVRRAIAFWAAAIFSFIIFTIWVVNLGTNLAGKNSQIASPFETIKNDLSNLGE